MPSVILPGAKDGMSQVPIKYDKGRRVPVKELRTALRLPERRYEVVQVDEKGDYASVKNDDYLEPEDVVMVVPKHRAG